MNGRFALIAALVVLPGLARAQAQSAPTAGAGTENVTYAYAQVLRADPIYETLRTHVPEKRCDPGCRVVQVERIERRITFYDVEYRYMGETYMSRVTYDPGSRLRIRVSVMPDDRPAGSR
jgi:hypothetical protein